MGAKMQESHAPYGRIVSACGNLQPATAPSHHVHRLAMPLQDGLALTRFGIPQPERIMWQTGEDGNGKESRGRDKKRKQVLLDDLCRARWKSITNHLNKFPSFDTQELPPHPTTRTWSCCRNYTRRELSDQGKTVSSSRNPHGP